MKFTLGSSCGVRGLGLAVEPDEFPDPEQDLAPDAAGNEHAVVLAGGCFWCVEAVFVELDGVLSVESGYAGGTADTADYRTVCTGSTDHAEVIRIRYNPARISYGQLLKVFFSVAHDPTQKDRQGNDVGRQYRSAVFYDRAAEKDVAAAYIAQLHAAGVFHCLIVTTLEPLETFYPAEEYHQDYARRNPRQPYVAAVSMPKVRKLREYYGDRLKNPAH